MTIKGSGPRVLRFAVTGVLLGAGPVSCDSAKDGTKAAADDGPTNTRRVEEPKPDNVNTRKVDEPKPEDEPPLKINPGPDEPGEDGKAPDTKTADTKTADLEVEPDNVNTRKVDEPPKPEIEERVNVAPVKEPVKIKTNTGRVRDPKTP